MNVLNKFRMKFAIIVALCIIFISAILMAKSDDENAINTYLYILIFGIVLLVCCGAAMLSKKL